MSALLNYKQQGSGDPVILIHGLFGNLDNLGSIMRNLQNDYEVISVDLRNHGLSFHSDEHTYQAMAEDVLRLTDKLQLSSLRVIGHSMGGKVAMKMAALRPGDIHSLVILDMAPVAYPVRRHDDVFNGLFAVINDRPTSRTQALDGLRRHIESEGVCQFLSKSLYCDEQGIYGWRFNVDALYHHYLAILGWEPIPPQSLPAQFIKGAQSRYILPEHQPDIVAQFPNAKAHVIANTGHWLHAEKPDEVIKVIRKFFAKTDGTFPVKSRS